MGKREKGVFFGTDYTDCSLVSLISFVWFIWLISFVLLIWLIWGIDKRLNVKGEMGTAPPRPFHREIGVK